MREPFKTHLRHTCLTSTAGVEDTRIAFLNDEIDKLEDQILQIRGDAGFTENDGR